MTTRLESIVNEILSDELTSQQLDPTLFTISTEVYGVSWFEVEVWYRGEYKMFENTFSFTPFSEQTLRDTLEEFFSSTDWSELVISYDNWKLMLEPLTEE